MINTDCARECRVRQLHRVGAFDADERMLKPNAKAIPNNAPEGPGGG